MRLQSNMTCDPPEVKGRVPAHPSDFSAIAMTTVVVHVCDYVCLCVHVSECVCMHIHEGNGNMSMCLCVL